MKFSDLLDSATCSSINRVAYNDLNHNIADVKLVDWTEALGEKRTDVLYFLTDKPDDQADSLNLVYLEKSSAILPGQKNIITFSDKSSFLSFYQQIKELIHLNHVALERLGRAYHALYNRINFQKLTDLACQIFGNPVLILDNIGNYMAFPTQLPITNPRLLTEKRNGRLSFDTLQAIKKHKIDEIIDHSRKPYFFYNPLLQTKTAIDKATINGTVLGRLILVEQDKPITDEDLLAFSYFSGIVALTFTHDPHFLQNKDLPFSYFLRGLLEKSLQQDEVIERQKRELSLDIRDYKRLILITFQQENVTEKVQLQLAQQLQKILGNCISTATNDGIIFLVSSSEKNFLQPLTEELLYFCRESHLTLITSHIFTKLNQIQHILRQLRSSKKCLQKYHLKGNLFSYRYLSNLIMVDILQDQEEVYIHPDIVTLQDYDLTKNQQLLESLAYYILYNQRYDSIAKALHLHPNTFRYRIRKIKELLKIDLDDWLLMKCYHDSLIQLFCKGQLDNQALILLCDSDYL